MFLSETVTRDQKMSEDETLQAISEGNNTVSKTGRLLRALIKTLLSIFAFKNSAL